MLHFTELSTTVGWKPGRWQAVPLGPRVVVIGKNTAGKSRLITALSLLVSGKAPGEVFGKEAEVALSSDLAMLYPTDDTETWGRTSDGRRLQPTKGGSPWVHPIRHITGSLRKPSIADTFLGQFIIDPKADVSALIPAFYADEAKANSSRPKVPSTVSELLSALSSASEHIRGLNQAVKQAEDGLSNNNAIADVSNDQISAAAALVQALEHDLSTVQQRTALASTREQAMQAKQQRDNRLAEIAEQTAQMEPMLAQYDAEIGRVEAMRPSYVDAVRQAEVGANGDLWRAMAALDANNPHSQGCPACASKIDRNAWRNWVQYNAEQAENAVVNARRALSDLDAYLAQGKTGRSTIGTKYDGLKREETWIAGQPPIVVPEVGNVPERAEDVEKLRADLAQAKRVHADLLKQKGAADQVATLRARLVRAETDSVWWKAWRDALNSAHGILLSRGVASFEQHVQRYMPTQYTFRLILEKPQGAATFRFGLETDGDKHIIVSGAQRALILFALAATCLDRLPPEDRPQMPVLMLDEERAIDGEHLTMLMQALSAAPYQVVVTSIVGPVKAVDGWQVLDLSTVSPTGDVALTSEVKKTRKPSTRKKADALVTADPYFDAGLPLASGGVAAPSDTVPAVSDGELDSLMPRLV